MILHQICPYCGKHNDRIIDVNPVSGEGRGEPESGDISLCMDCGEFCEFDYDLVLQKPDPETLRAMAHNPEVLHIKEMWRQFKGIHQ